MNSFFKTFFAALLALLYLPLICFFYSDGDDFRSGIPKEKPVVGTKIGIGTRS